jgi:hypothetical protein
VGRAFHRLIEFTPGVRVASSAKRSAVRFERHFLTATGNLWSCES